MNDNQEWVLKRNCSIAPRQLLVAYGGLCSLSVAIASFFTWHGAWYVMGFSMLEMGAVGIAFLFFARHATDRERIALDQDWLLIELIQAEQAISFKLDPRTARIQIPAAHHLLITIEERGTRVEIGRFLTYFKRQQFAQELRSALSAHAISRSGRSG